jgi:HSP20 family protein
VAVVFPYNYTSPLSYANGSFFCIGGKEQANTKGKGGFAMSQQQSPGEQGFQEHLLPPLPLREPAFELSNRENALILKATIPGFLPEDLEITLNQDQLLIRGKREEESHLDKGDFWHQEQKSSAFIRTISFPQKIDPDKAKITMDRGVLSIIMPKLNAPLARTFKFESHPEGKFLH